MKGIKPRPHLTLETTSLGTKKPKPQLNLFESPSPFSTKSSHGESATPASGNISVPVSPTSPFPQPGQRTPLGRGFQKPSIKIPDYSEENKTYLGQGAFGQTYQVSPDQGLPFIIKEIDTARATVHALGQPLVDTKDIQKHIEKMHVEAKVMQAVSGHLNIPEFRGLD